MPAATVAKNQACPECGATVVDVAGFIAWCTTCDWNVDPSPQRDTRGFFSRRAARGSERAARRLASLLFGAFGVLALGFGLWVPFRLFIGTFLLAVALYAQPFRRRSPHYVGPLYLRPEEAPTLYALVGRVADALGAPKPDRIGIDWRYNASFGRRPGAKRGLVLGASLWTVLSPPERVSIIGHELGHSLNGDQRRKRPVRLAIVSLAHWHSLFRPEGSRGPLRHAPGLSGTLAAIVLPLVLVPLAVITYGLAWALRVVGARHGMASEYYADELGARAAGPGAAASCLEKFLVGRVCTDFVLHTARFGKPGDLWISLKQFADDIPATEIERQRRIGRLRLPSIDSEHPPSQLRADVLMSKPPFPALVRTTDAEQNAIDMELAPAMLEVARRLHTRVTVG
ncbi:MAG TPA: M48 family metalloprotease [Acidimicrobiales bacterium]|nr:M48 family metalloprotease [Acidimicrobiales bacterium]